MEMHIGFWRETILPASMACNADTRCRWWGSRISHQIHLRAREQVVDTVVDGDAVESPGRGTPCGERGGRCRTGPRSAPRGWQDTRWRADRRCGPCPRCRLRAVGAASLASFLRARGALRPAVGRAAASFRFLVLRPGRTSGTACVAGVPDVPVRGEGRRIALGRAIHALGNTHAPGNTPRGGTRGTVPSPAPRRHDSTSRSRDHRGGGIAGRSNRIAMGGPPIPRPLRPARNGIAHVPGPFYAGEV